MTDLGPTLSRPPGGVCAICHAPATKWAGSIEQMPNGRVRRFGIGVCDACLSRMSPEEIARASGAVLPSDAPPTSIAVCSDASIAESP